MTERPTIPVTHDTTAHRFHADVDGGRAVASYHREGDRMVLTHTSVPSDAEGQGVGSALAREALGFARSQGLKVVPNCPFMAAYLQRHPEYHDLC